jgi:N-acyl-D-aspartate/D-glutamate deacylase
VDVPVWANDKNAEMHDLVVRHAHLVDGTGAPGRPADIAVTDGVITEVAEHIGGTAKRVIDANGMVVTPGFVDIHTHFDGQATWDPILAPSSQHGVTSLVMGNCGVGFAPARPTDADHAWLIGLLEGVEDIPGSALAEGLTWDWETFPDYLNALRRREWTVDVGTQVAHAPLRAYVMGERGADPNEAPTADELDAMARQIREGVRAGALGFTTSRTYIHRTNEGKPLGTRFSSIDELTALTSALSDENAGVIQLISDAYLSDDEELATREMALMEEVARTCGRPMSMTVQQPFDAPDRWKRMLAWTNDAASRGINLKTQVAPRPIGVLHGLDATVTPFMLCPTFGLLTRLPRAERVAELSKSEVREAILREHPENLQRASGVLLNLCAAFEAIFPMTDPVDYEPGPDSSIAAIAARQGLTPAEVAYDYLLRDNGKQLLYMPLFNYVSGNLDAVREMLLSPRSVIGLSDAGAHCGAISDASFTTTALAHWTRDRTRGEKLPLEFMVHHITQRTAQHVGWNDRGVVAPGMLADLNVIDMDALAAAPPRLVNDLPAGGRRLVQDARGYVATVKSGVVTFENGQHTGTLPGRFIAGTRGAGSTIPV